MGGREVKNSLLTACLIVADEHFKVLDELYLLVKPDDGEYIVTGGGMAVNKINIAEHDKVAITYKTAKPLLFNFLSKHVGWIPNGSKSVSPLERLVPVGHGVRGDIEHLLKLISAGSWDQFCTYHYLDTSVALQFLRAAGKMPVDEDGSLEALAKYFDLKPEGELHDARTDARLNLQVLRCMLGLIK